MIDLQKCFDEVLDIINLKEHKRHNAASAKYEELPKEFRTKLLKLVLYLMEHPEKIDKEVTMRSPYGTVALTDSFFTDIRTTFPEVIGV